MSRNAGDSDLAVTLTTLAVITRDNGDTCARDMNAKDKAAIANQVSSGEYPNYRFGRGIPLLHGCYRKGRIRSNVTGHSLRALNREQ